MAKNTEKPAYRRQAAKILVRDFFTQYWVYPYFPAIFSKCSEKSSKNKSLFLSLF